MEGGARRSKRIQQQNITTPAVPESDISGAASPESSSTEPTYDNVSAKAPTRKSRPSKREKLKNPRANQPCISQSSDASQAGAVVLQPARPDPAWIRGRRGHLKFIVEVPLDVLCEIFSELDPVDLLHLSWSCKNLHAIVMSKSGKRLWESAFARLYESEHPPPSCPDDLNFAQYARFLFVNKCMDCGAGPAKHDSWGMRLRVCWDCLQSGLFIHRHYRSIETYSEFLASIPARNDVYYRRSEFMELIQRSPHLPEGKQLREQYKRKKEGYNSYNDWKLHRNQVKQEKLEATRLVRDSMKLTRKAVILQKLDEIGWKESEIEEITEHKIDRLPGFARSKPLTNKEWDTLRPQLVDRLQELKRAHTEHSRQAELRRRYEAFKRNVFDWKKSTGVLHWGIKAVDLAVLEPFKSALFTFPPETANIKFSTAEIDPVAIKWIHSQYDFILPLLPQELRERVPAQPELDKYSPQDLLASLTFRCETSPFISKYRDPVFSFESVGKLRFEGQYFRHPDEPELSASLALVTNKTPWEWDHPKISFYPEAHEIAKSHIKLLGEDPNTATISQMERCERRLGCRWCHRSNKNRPLCYLPSVEHQIVCHKNSNAGGTQWHVVKGG